MASKIPGIFSEGRYASTENEKIKFKPQVMEMYSLIISKSGAKCISEKHWPKVFLQGDTAAELQGHLLLNKPDFFYPKKHIKSTSISVHF